MSMQPLFRRFHEAIQLKRFDENAELVEKRDRVLKRLRENIRGPKGERMSFEPFNQGSYAMGTGIKPLNGDYDIDVGIEFAFSYLDYSPVEVKRWVYEAIKTHTSRVEWRRPCLTVYYQHENEPLYHVDLAIMAQDPYTRKVRLALGKQHSAADQQKWQPDDRKGFIEAIQNHLTSENAAQFRRVIRYLKRWKDQHFSPQGHAAPTGLSLTVAAYKWFRPMAISSEYNDLSATAGLVEAMLNGFRDAWNPETARNTPRLSLLFPMAPQDDVFEWMSPQQMVEFRERLRTLAQWLEDARVTGNTAPLRQAFGDHFPIR
ncbi:nucleotidyltransferase [Corallococcus terminator]